MSAAWDIRHVDLSSGQPTVAANPRPLFVVFRWAALPLGVRTYLPEQLPLHRSEIAAVTADLASAQLAARSPRFAGPARATYDGKPLLPVPADRLQGCGDLLKQLDEFADTTPISAAPLSVIICTRDRREALERCLAALMSQTSRAGQIVVVDNSRNRSAETVSARFPDVDYLHEPRPGLSAARNAGVRASKGALVAFTDDDVEPSPSWTMEIVRAFSSAAVDAVTGLVLPARLETSAQCYFQFKMGGFGSECVPLIFDRRFLDETRSTGAQVWRIGAGANMAFRRSVFDRVGLFDERLGAGASGCSEDSELWYRLIAGGGACLFEPRAVVVHHHREQWAELRRQVRSYMKGHVSALFVQAARHRHGGNIRRIFTQLPAYFARSAFWALRDGAGVGRFQILWEEMIGWLYGLQYAFRPRWRARPVDMPASTPPGQPARQSSL
ncbi:MAG TPA: glycosyltransferase [Dongiaceae bacterium]|nr:glycosyltransferase [Dongiaceae bacterium]